VTSKFHASPTTDAAGGRQSPPRQAASATERHHHRRGRAPGERSPPPHHEHGPPQATSEGEVVLLPLVFSVEHYCWCRVYENPYGGPHALRALAFHISTTLAALVSHAGCQHARSGTKLAGGCRQV